MKILVLVRRLRYQLSNADEHDFTHNKKVLNNLKKNIFTSHFIKYDLLKNYKKYIKWNPNFVIFLGFHEDTLEIKKQFINSKFAIWAKCYASYEVKKFKEFYENLNLIFDSCYLSNLNYKKNYFYLPTAIHNNYKENFFKKIYFLFYKKSLENQAKKVDIMFSGSPRFNRADNYRQELIKILVEKGLKILISAPKKHWDKSNFKIDAKYEKNIFFSNHNYWATEEMYKNCKFVLDLPWLDTVIPELERNFDPQFSLGWNVFRSGYYGTNLITYDCRMNRNLGLNDENCNFYKSNIKNLIMIADEIENIVKNYDPIAAKTKIINIERLFKSNHTYNNRWRFILSKINNNVKN